MKYLLLLITLASSPTFAMSYGDAHKLVATMNAEVDALNGPCDAIQATATNLQTQLTQLSDGINAMNAQDADLQDAVAQAALGQEAVTMALTECVNYDAYGHSNGATLLDMYLMHIDNDLVKSEYHVGSGLNKK